MSSTGAIGVAVVQTPAVSTSAEAALDHLDTVVAQLGEQGADVVVLPELAVTGYDLTLDYPAIAEATTELTTARLTALAVRTQTTVVTAVPRLDTSGRLHNCSLVLTADGREHRGAKRYLWGGERAVFQAGDASGLLVPTAVGTVGVVICYEAGFPETVRELAVAGADVIAVPAAFGRARRHIWQLLTVSRAVENGCIVAAAGLCGENGQGVAFAGHSTVVDPRGTRLVELGDTPDAAVVHVPAGAIEQARAELPYLADLQRMSRSRVTAS
ncbi:carbon-nitrogen hydrolase family protein [Rhodococcus sp. X156]|uniref:carbon-nitrogen hydrolase family protein n=1 Tax=Rhodococcus sp. X156 TaxID=2499145 RepID=UPI0013E2E887|nr:carbon-nitrogen hydrolase family protein [Rhodococcus sp. X156]